MTNTNMWSSELLTEGQNKIICWDITIHVQREWVFVSMLNGVSVNVWILTSPWDTIEIHDWKLYVRDALWWAQSFAQYFWSQDLLEGPSFFQVPELDTIPIKERAMSLI